jgi:hypothetical protein
LVRLLSTRLRASGPASCQGNRTSARSNPRQACAPEYSQVWRPAQLHCKPRHPRVVSGGSDVGETTGLRVVPAVSRRNECARCACVRAKVCACEGACSCLGLLSVGSDVVLGVCAGECGTHSI